MLPEAERQELRAKYGEQCCLHEFEKHGAFIFRKPSGPVFSKFSQSVEQKKLGTKRCFDQLAMDCLCYPETEAGKPDYARLQALFDEYPGASMDDIGDDLVKLAQAKGSQVTGKL